MKLTTNDLEILIEAFNIELVEKYGVVGKKIYLSVYTEKNINSFGGKPINSGSYIIGVETIKETRIIRKEHVFAIVLNRYDKRYSLPSTLSNITAHRSEFTKIQDKLTIFIRKKFNKQFVRKIKLERIL